MIIPAEPTPKFRLHSILHSEYSWWITKQPERTGAYPYCCYHPPSSLTISSLTTRIDQSHVSRFGAAVVAYEKVTEGTDG